MIKGLKCMLIAVLGLAFTIHLVSKFNVGAEARAELDAKVCKQLIGSWHPDVSPADVKKCRKMN